MPENQATKPTAMNRPILTLLTGTPTARELGAEPPTAKIQLPTWVRSRTQVAIDDEQEPPQHGDLDRRRRRW